MPSAQLLSHAKLLSPTVEISNHFGVSEPIFLLYGPWLRQPPWPDHIGLGVDRGNALDALDMFFLFVFVIQCEPNEDRWPV